MFILKIIGRLKIGWATKNIRSTSDGNYTVFYQMLETFSNLQCFAHLQLKTRLQLKANFSMRNFI